MSSNEIVQRTGNNSMRWAWRIGRLAGVDVFVHATFLVLIGWVVLGSWFGGAGLGPALAAAGFMLLLFGCVVLHELGHALAARQFGIQTRDITLLPIGGVARLERIPESPRQELWVALAGPAVNLVIAIGLFLWMGISTSGALSELSLSSGSLTGRLLAANVSLVLFNLLPGVSDGRRTSAARPPSSKARVHSRHSDRGYHWTSCFCRCGRACLSVRTGRNNHVNQQQRRDP